MRLYVNNDKLRSWIRTATLANTTYFRVRRDLWNGFLGCLALDADDPAAVSFIESESYIVLKLFLTSRNDGMSDNNRLAFERTLEQLAEAFP